MSIKSYRTYTGKDLFTIDGDRSQPIIEGLLYEKDFVLVVGKAKTNKSIFSMQIASSISSGTPFLDTFDVPKPRMVWYFATEGKDNDIKERFYNMSQGVDIDSDNILLICSPGFRFNTEEGVLRLNQLLKENGDRLPNVIIIDALYKSIKGSMKDDNNITDFLHVVGEFADKCHSAVILVHHKTKTMYNQGKALDRGDEDTYGSSFLLNAVDHSININGTSASKSRDISITTQRSGNIVDNLKVELVAPIPLCLRIIGTGSDREAELFNIIHSSKNGVSFDQISKKFDVGKTTIYSMLKNLQANNQISKDDKHRPVLYMPYRDK
jgi:hypothetical protein